MLRGPNSLAGLLRDRASYIVSRFGCRAYGCSAVNAAVKSKSSDAKPSKTLWLAGLTVRTLFIAILVIITLRVSSPQVEHISSVLETPTDVVRLLLGLGVCIWLVVHVFVWPRDDGAYRTWTQLGFILLPLAALCAYITW